MSKHDLIAVVDDDLSVRESLLDLAPMLGYEVLAFACPEDFLQSDRMAQTRCLILDVTMPGMSGPELLAELKLRGQQIPVIFITGHRDQKLRARLLRLGAVDCLFKPFSDSALEAAVSRALPS